MKIKPNSKAYNQIKSCLEEGQKTLGKFTGNDTRLIGYLWEAFWLGQANLNLCLVFETWNQFNAAREIRLPEGCNDNHIETALKHIYNQQSRE